VFVQLLEPCGLRNAELLHDADSVAERGKARGDNDAILEKGNHQVTRHLGKRAVHRARQTGERKGKRKCVVL
jgi:hypothetical protein